MWPGGTLKLNCPLPSNLANTTWERDGSALTSRARFQLLQDGLLILNASNSDAGRYRCLSMERSKAGYYTTTVAEYQVSISAAGSGDGNHIFPQAQRNGPSVAGLQAAVGLLVVFLLMLLTWSFYKGHIPLPWNCRKKNREQTGERLDTTVVYRGALAEDKPLASGRDNGTSIHNQTREKATASAAENDVPHINLPSLQFIDDESEI